MKQGSGCFITGKNKGKNVTTQQKWHTSTELSKKYPTFTRFLSSWVAFQIWSILVVYSRRRVHLQCSDNGIKHSLTLIHKLTTQFEWHDCHEPGSGISLLWAFSLVGHSGLENRSKKEGGLHLVYLTPSKVKGNWQWSVPLVGMQKGASGTRRGWIWHF